jgi:hypothetical protein
MSKHKATQELPFHKLFSEETLKHARAAHEELHKSVKALFPPEFIEHRRRARREMLLAVRSMIDTALERSEESPAK